MNNSDIWLVAVTAGRWQRHGIREARSAGIKVLAIDSDPNAEGFNDADETLVVSFDDYEEVIKLVRNLGLNIKGAVSFCSEAGMILAAKLREAFDLPGPREDICRRLLNKVLQRKIWTEKSIPGPRWAVCQDLDDTVRAIKAFGFPLIIKPADSSGSRGVTKLESIDDDFHEAAVRAFQYSSNGSVLIEEYMDGTEFTVEVFASDGSLKVLAVTEKKKIAGTRGTVAYELATPDRSKEVISSISDTVIQAFLALGYFDGPGHAEVILNNDDSIGLIEVAGRGGGFMVFDYLVPKVSGVNIARLTAQQAVGLKLSEVVVKDKSAVLRFFPARPGLLKVISGFDEANCIANVEAESFVKTGIILEKAVTDGDRLGYILSCADTPRDAQHLANQAESLIHFDIEAIT